MISFSPVDSMVKDQLFASLSIESMGDKNVIFPLSEYLAKFEIMVSASIPYTLNMQNFSSKLQVEVLHFPG